MAVFTLSACDIMQVGSGNCEAAASSSVNYEQIYKPVLDDFYAVIRGRGDSYSEYVVGVVEATRFNNNVEESMNSVGYTIQDLSGDGVPELLIGSMDNNLYSMIYALYTCRNGAPMLNFVGMSRNSYVYLGEGRLLNHGSNGAAYIIFGDYKLSYDGTSLMCNDLYFTYEKDPGFSEIGFYHNASGIFDKKVSEELKVTSEQFWDIHASLAKDAQHMELIPFAEYRCDNVVRVSSGETIKAMYAENALKCTDYLHEYIADSSKESAKILFIANKRVYDFKVLSLYYNNDRFESTELYTLDELNRNESFMLRMRFVGAMPSYGISYVDEYGVTRKFGIIESGKDGSLILDEI